MVRIVVAGRGRVQPRRVGLMTTRTGAAGRSAIGAAEALLGAVGRLDTLTVPELLDLRERTEALLAQKRPSIADTAELLSRLPAAPARRRRATNR